MFEEFINYYHTFNIEQIDEKMIIAFLQYLVIDRKVSTSYQNQSINAIKFYFEQVLGGKRKFYFLERPRKEKKLPTVLNEDEITKAINTVTNIKHKAIIMITYSGGLRISETSKIVSMIGPMATRKILKNQALGRLNQASAPNWESKSISLCFQRHCNVPKAQRKRCLAKARIVSGASVQATAREA